MQTLRRVTEETQDTKIAVKKCSNIYKLDAFMENGFIRVGGRPHNAPIKIDARHPIILPKKHHVVNLIIGYYHRASGHSGVEYTLSLLRQGYWIIDAQSIVRNIINKCFNCRRRQAPVIQQKMASLPEDRITPSKPPFTYVGVDCFGPFLVLRGRATAKRYGVCLSVLPSVQSTLKSYTLWTLNPLSMLYVALFQSEDVQKKLGQTTEETS